MKLKMGGFWSAAWLVLLGATLCAQTAAPAQPAPTQADQPTFRIQVDLVTTDVIPRDEKGNFIADLSKNEFEIFEDGVKQEITSMTVSHGGRITNVLAPPPPVLASEGLVLPPTRPVNDVSGRIFVFFVDDLHLQFGNTGRVRELFKKISKQLIHDGDLFGIVSSGPSSISVQMTYDKRRLDEAINKMTGSELKPEEIIEQSGTAPGAPSEVRFRVGVAFKTVYELLQNLDKVRDRRKALVYVSDGYDLNPFEDSRLGLMDPSSPFLQNTMQRALNQEAKFAGEERAQDPTLTHPRAAGQFSDAELTTMLAELTREANRSNVTMYTIDPRGLVGPLSDLDQEVEPHAVAGVRAQVAGQPARARGGDRRHRRRQPERLRQGAAADRRRDERLLRARVLLEQSRPHAAPPQDRGARDAPRGERLVAQGVRAQGRASAAAGAGAGQAE